MPFLDEGGAKFKDKCAVTVPVKTLSYGLDAKALVAAEDHKKTGKPPNGQVETNDTLAMLPVWQQLSTTLAAKSVWVTGAAQLEYGLIENDKFLRVPNWRKILKEIGWDKHGFVSRFLRELVYWHGRSTNGRFNDKLNRFARWGVKSTEQWRTGYKRYVPNPAFDPKHFYDEPQQLEIPLPMSRTRFFLVKDRLMDLGLIEAESHLWHDTTCLWIKPTEELSRIVFEPGYWETVRGKYAFVPTKKKPRGVHVKGKAEPVDTQSTAEGEVPLGTVGS